MSPKISTGITPKFAILQEISIWHSRKIAYTCKDLLRVFLKCVMKKKKVCFKRKWWEKMGPSFFVVHAWLIVFIWFCSLIKASHSRMTSWSAILAVALHHPRFARHVGVTLPRERRRLDTRAKPSTRNVLGVMSANNPLALSSLSGEKTSACVENATIQVMLR